jgi:hypothetical protein
MTFLEKRHLLHLVLTRRGSAVNGDSQSPQEPPHPTNPPPQEPPHPTNPQPAPPPPPHTRRLHVITVSLAKQGSQLPLCLQLHRLDVRHRQPVPFVLPQPHLRAVHTHPGRTASHIVADNGTTLSPNSPNQGEKSAEKGGTRPIVPFNVEAITCEHNGDAHPEELS